MNARSKAQQQMMRLARQRQAQQNAQQPVANNDQQLKQKRLEHEEKIRQEMNLADKLKRDFNQNKN